MELVLGIAERQVAAIILNSKKQGDLNTARMMRSIRKSLELLALGAEINEMMEDAKKLGTDMPDWDDLLSIGEPDNFSISKDALEWLRSELVAKDWSVAEMRGENNRIEKINVPVSSAQMEAVANLADAVDAALTQKVGGDA